MKNHNNGISIIIRFKNEEKYLGSVYEAIIKQRIRNRFEIISVNNNSTDSSREIASKFSTKILDIDNYEPGVALNRAIEESSGEIIVVVSAHTIPGNKFWLQNLVSPLYQDNAPIAIYGAQIYPYYSCFLDKRDLDIFNFAQKRIEKENTDFWNANSCFLKQTWSAQKFCETVYELEDHYWTKVILSHKKGYVFFNPDAYVYHYGHYERIDRKYPYITEENQLDYYNKAVNFLSNSNEWSDVMRGSLIFNSLPSQLIDDKVIRLLGKHLQDHWDFDVRWRIAQTLGNINNNESVAHLVRTLFDESFYPRNEAAWSLRKLLPISLDQVIKVFHSTSGEPKLYSSFVMAASNKAEIVKLAFNYLNELLTSGKDHEIRNSLYIIGEVTKKSNVLETYPKIFKLIEENQISNKTLPVAIWCIGKIYENNGFSFPISLILHLSKTHKNFLVRYEAINSISRYVIKSKNTSIFETLKNIAQSENDDRVIYAIFQALRTYIEFSDKSYQFCFEVNSNDFGVKFERRMIERV